MLAFLESDWFLVIGYLFFTFKSLVTTFVVNAERFSPGENAARFWSWQIKLILYSITIYITTFFATIPARTYDPGAPLMIAGLPNDIVNIWMFPIWLFIMMDLIAGFIWGTMHDNPRAYTGPMALYRGEIFYWLFGWAYLPARPWNRRDFGAHATNEDLYYLQSVLGY